MTKIFKKVRRKKNMSITWTHPDLETYLNKIKKSHWIPAEVSFALCDRHFQELEPREQHYIKMALAFFARVDQMVGDNALQKLPDRRYVPIESIHFYAHQTAQETVHAETYDLMIRALGLTAQELDTLVNSQESIVKRKLQFVQHWLDCPITDAKSYAMVLLAFTATEGISFCTSFLIFHWLRHYRPAKCLGLVQGNEFIQRDELLHRDHGIQVARECFSDWLQDSKFQCQVQSMIQELVAIEDDFVHLILPHPIDGLQPGHVLAFVRYMTNQFYLRLGWPPLFPELIYLQNPIRTFDTESTVKSNFFEVRPSNYQIGGYNHVRTLGSNDSSLCDI